MEREGRGYHVAARDGIREGQRYAYRLDGGPERPDPCSLWQPEGVDGPSAVVFPDRFSWTDRDWRGVRQADLVFYEIHVGTFTPEGTFEAIIPRLKDLSRAGYHGHRDHASRPVSGLTKLGLRRRAPVCGPEYLRRSPWPAKAGRRLPCPRDWPSTSTSSTTTSVRKRITLASLGLTLPIDTRRPWGAAVNYDRAGCDAVRDFVLDNVRMWLEEFHIDGLRLDAADTIFDMGARHILRAIKEVAHEAGRRRGWPAVVTAESDLNDPRLLYPADAAGMGSMPSGWTTTTMRPMPFSPASATGTTVTLVRLRNWRKVLEQPFLYHWDYSAFRDRKHGARPEGLAGDRFVVFLQNHDQVGNRASGDRLNTLMKSPAKQAARCQLSVAVSVLAAAVHGRRIRRGKPVPVLLLVSR